MTGGDYLIKLKGLIQKESKIVKEITSIKMSSRGFSSREEKDLLESQIRQLKKVLEKTVDEISSVLDDMSVTKPLPKTNFGFETPKKTPQKKTFVSVVKKDVKKIEPQKHISENELRLNRENRMLEKGTLKRLGKKRKVVKKQKEKKPSSYVGFANKLFRKHSQDLAKEQFFISLKDDLAKAHIGFVSTSYISTMILTSLIALGVGFFVFLFFLFFNVSAEFPIITQMTEGLFSRFLKTFWIIFAAPIFTFLAMYVYPSLEKSYIENKIDSELPFATIHMAAISESMLEPSKMFSILISTNEYPFIQREFTKIINEINVYGYDFVTAVRNVAFDCPSQSLAELLNGIATTINSGGELVDFFEKRGQSLLFEYKIERESKTKGAETFMDIYISLVIAAPMIIMLLLMMMRVSGLGINLSTSMITLVMILGVAMLNIIFLVFLQLKNTSV